MVLGAICKAKVYYHINHCYYNSSWGTFLSSPWDVLLVILAWMKFMGKNTTTNTSEFIMNALCHPTHTNTRAHTHPHMRAHTHTHSTHRAHRDSAVKSIVCVRERAYMLHAWLLFCSIMLAAISDQCTSVHYVCPHVLMKLSRVMLCLRICSVYTPLERVLSIEWLWGFPATAESTFFFISGGNSTETVAPDYVRQREQIEMEKTSVFHAITAAPNRRTCGRMWKVLQYIMVAGTLWATYAVFVAGF